MSANGLTLLTTLYYRLRVSATDPTSVSSDTNFTNPENQYAGISNFFMTDANYKANKDVMSFVGYRTAAKVVPEGFSIYPIYNETLNIQTPTGIVSAVAVYADVGTGLETSVPSVEYAVTSAQGEFVGAQIVTIFFNNVDKTRKVEIYV
jgi:hypothetical protein